ncbi:peptide ABC transporter substrate-binding protein, partial [Candidatus Similichlamydia epinepheli]|uniref:peptide ABC transporter substrate-binding protein n=1 Tax=Candidatus Similichlamydia epinepheli TaxID=1903953 RepID=UPI00130081DC
MQLRLGVIIGLLFVSSLCFKIFYVNDSSFGANERKKDTLVLNLGALPIELHPQFLSNSNSSTISLHIYEGLFRLGTDKTVIPGLAENMLVSDDGLNYRIQLRKSFWSNGLPLTAHDFVRSWKHAILPEDGKVCFGSMHFDFFTGVEEFRNGTSSWSNVAIVAEDDYTLLFTLKHPVPYFKDLLTLPVFYPIYQDYNTSSYLVTNGPFYVKSFKHEQSLILKKNPFYWDANAVNLSQIKFMFVESTKTQTLLFEQGELDCIGGGFLMVPQEDADRLSPSGCVSDQYDVATVSHLILNTKAPPFASHKVRLAFSMAIDREELGRGIFKRSFPAYSYLPPSFSTRKGARLIQESPQVAKLLLEEGLQDLGMSIEDLGEVRLLCSERGADGAQVLQRQWAEKLGVLIKIEILEFRSIFSCLKEGDFHMSISCIVANYRDPYTFFD